MMVTTKKLSNLYYF